MVELGADKAVQLNGQDSDEVGEEKAVDHHDDDREGVAGVVVQGVNLEQGADVIREGCRDEG